MKKQIVISSVTQLAKVAEQVLHASEGRRIFAFSGEMGAGKTTLIAALCHALGVTDQVSSPTFAIINEYQGVERISHLDLFRLKTMEEALAIGIEDYLSEKEYLFIEWPELIRPLLPQHIVQLHLEIVNEQERILTIDLP